MSTLLLFSLCVLSIFSVVVPDTIYHTQVKHHEQRFIKDFDFIHENVRHFTSGVIKPIFERAVQDVNVTQKCVQSLRILLDNPDREWASLMIDSSGRILNSGFLSGTITDYGDFDQCMSIKRLPDTEIGTVSAQYCWLSIRPPLPPMDVELDFKGSEYEKSWAAERFSTPRSRLYYRIASGLCLPNTCTSQEITDFLKKTLETTNIELNDVLVSSCQSPEHPKTLDFAQWFSITILLFLAICVVVGTSVDCHQPKCPKQTRRLEFWTSFSFTRNTRALFSIQEYSGDETSSFELTPIHGLRVLLILWVITCHSTNFAPLGFYDQPMIASRFATDLMIVRDFWTQFVLSGSLSVQAFFIISGLISLHTSLKNADTFAKSVPYWRYVFFRWIRFAPPLVGMFCFMFLWPYFSSGPLNHWDFLKFGHEPCYHRWWANFLFVSNNYILTEQCGSHTWFLSADFQINLFAYFVILAYIKNYRTGLRLNVIALLASFILPTVVHWVYNVPLVHILETDFEKLNKVFSLTEFYFFNHFAAYFAGMLIAGILNLRTKRTLKKHIQRIFWWISLGLVVTLPFSTYPFIQMDEIPINFVSLSFTGIKRFLWITALSWIIFASSSFSKHTTVARFLSAKIFQPFSRLTFCIYLVQSLVIWVYTYTSRSLHPISHSNTIFRIGGVTLYSLVAAFILYILFEAPSVNLVKLLFKSFVSQPKKCEKEVTQKIENNKRESSTQEEFTELLEMKKTTPQES